MSPAVPRVRPELRYVRQVIKGVPSYVVKDPVSLQYFRFGEVEVFLMERMDGTRTLERLAEEARQELGIDAGAASLEPFVARLQELGLALRPPSEQRIILVETLRRERRLKLKGHGSTLLRMRFSLGDPDRLFDRWVPRLRFFWTPAFVWGSVLAFLVYGLVVALNWDAFIHGVAALYSPEYYRGGTVVLLYATIALVIAIHELGHGLTCKRFGGEVHEMGAMLLYFMPAFYCNVNDAWTFERRSERLWVTFAGGWIQGVVAAAAAVVWVSTPPHTIVHQVSFFALIFAGGVALLLNFNPLIPLDGYYALMDWLEIPNLRQRSFAYTSASFRRNVLRIPISPPAVTARERRIFLGYGVGAVVYSTLLLGTIGLLAGEFLVDRFGAWGGASVAGGSFLLLRRPLRSIATTLRGRLAGGGLRRAVRTFGPAAAILGGATLLLAGLVPWTLSVHAPAEVEPARRVWLRAPEPARMAAAHTTEERLVGVGDTLVVLQNDILDLEIARAEESRALAEREVSRLRSGSSTEALRSPEIRLAVLEDDVQRLRRRRSALTLVSPYPARVVTPHLVERVGAGVEAGDSVVELWTPGPAVLRLAVPQRDAGGLRLGGAIRVRFPSHPRTTWEARVVRLAPAAQAGNIEAFAALPEAAADAGIRPGMVGRAKVDVGHTRVGGALLHWLRRQVRVDLFL